MRWLFLFVLSLNLAYIAWEMSKPSSDAYVDVAPLKNVKPIVLLSELRQQQADAARSEQAEDAVIAAGGTESAGTEAKQQAVSKKTSTKQTALADKVSQVSALETPQPETVTGQAEPTKQVAQVATVTQQAEPVKTAAGASPATSSCYTLGPFRDLDNLRALTREIKSYVVEADFRGREEKEPTLYWVFLKPEKNRKKAIETGNRLKAKKIKDFYIIRDGEKENGLSLGHFRNKDGAYGLAKKVRNLGFDVDVEPVFKSYTIYWLDYQLASDAIIPESIFDKYTKTGKKDKISRLGRECGS
jgi:cell division protein FtsN